MHANVWRLRRTRIASHTCILNLLCGWGHLPSARRSGHCGRLLVVATLSLWICSNFMSDRTDIAEAVQDCVEYFKTNFEAEVESRVVREEHVSFPLPRELRMVSA